MAITVLHNPFHHERGRLIEPGFRPGAKRGFFVFHVVGQFGRLVHGLLIRFAAKLGDRAVSLVPGRLQRSPAGSLRIAEHLSGFRFRGGDGGFGLGFCLHDAVDRFKRHWHTPSNC